MQRPLDSWPPEEKNSIWGQRRGLIAQSFCEIKFYSSIKEIEKTSDIGIRRGQKEYPPASVSHGVIYSLISYYSESKECLEVVKTSLDLLPYLHLKIRGLARSFFSRDCPQTEYIIVI